jgi:hypothetical protein
LNFFLTLLALSTVKEIVKSIESIQQSSAKSGGGLNGITSSHIWSNSRQLLSNPNLRIGCVHSYSTVYQYRPTFIDRYTVGVGIVSMVASVGGALMDGGPRFHRRYCIPNFNNVFTQNKLAVLRKVRGVRLEPCMVQARDGTGRPVDATYPPVYQFHLWYK